MRRICTYLFAFAALLGASAAEAQAPKLGWINTQRLRAEAPGVAEARTTLQTEARRWEAQVDSLQKELERLQGDFQRQQASLSATARQQREQEFRQRFTAAQQRVAQIQQSARQREAALFDPISRRIEQAVEAVRKEGNYAMIFDSSTLATADPALDLTARVLERLRRPAG